MLRDRAKFSSRANELADTHTLHHTHIVILSYNTVKMATTKHSTTGHPEIYLNNKMLTGNLDYTVTNLPGFMLPKETI